ncbi:MAG: ISNCY family transposase [Chloroflexi bacterium]|nr:ISNCY family transposase [Chloroflexota bacterium]
MKETIALNNKEQRRLMVLNQVLQGHLTAYEAGELLGLSVRQIRRMVAAYRKEGAAALSHGNRGRTPHNALSDEMKQRVAELACTKYRGCNQQHMSELLAEQEGILVSRSTLRNTLLDKGISSPRKRRAPKHRSRRERYPQEGQLWQIDASPHDWLQGRGPRLSLLAAIDDATGTMPAAVFRQEEDTAGYMLLMREGILRHGRPQAVYHDRHSIFVPTPRRMVEWSIEEQLRGEQEPTQFGRMLGELSITSIIARSPQAKGRVERLFGTLQSRLVIELRLAGATNEQEANLVLQQYLPRFNERFGLQAAGAEQGSSYSPLTETQEVDPDTVFCMKYLRTVGADNCVRFFGHRLQVLPGPQRMSYVHAVVEVHERLDGSLAVYYKGECLAHQSAPNEAALLRARKGPRFQAQQEGEQKVVVYRLADTQLPSAHKPASNHPWRAYPNRFTAR